MQPTPALVLFSGGQDSTTCLYWSKKNFASVEALFFHYEQRHSVEYQSVKYICLKEGIALHELHIPAFKEIGGSAMIEKIDIESGKNNMPNTFVPGRNIVFLTLAASLAYSRGMHDIVIGVNDSDYSGYPDCREDFIISMQRSLELGLDRALRIHTPLQSLDKAGIWELSDKLGVMDLVIEHSHTCYIGDHSTLHPWGYGCGKCPACILRKNGFESYINNKQ